MSALRKESSGRIVYPVRVGVRGGQIVRLKFCPDCGQDKVVSDDKHSEVGLNGRKADGTLRDWKPVCKNCYAARQRKRRQADPDAAHDIDRLARERIREDPERAATERDYWRTYRQRRAVRDPEWHRKDKAAKLAWHQKKRAEDPKYFSAERKAARKAAGVQVVEAPRTCPRVPTGPWAQWLEVYQAARGIPDMASLAEHLGVCVKRVQGAMTGAQDYITVDVVDVSLLAASIVQVDGREIVTFSDLYPDGI